MSFPDYPRQVYRKNALEQVICQLRFPPILKIGIQVPFEFQDEVRSHYPMYSASVEMPAEPPPGIQVQAVPIPVANRMNYQFYTEDEVWYINLSDTHLSVATHQYTCWEDFKAHLDLPLQAFLKIYRPAFFTRVGLRYINALRRSRLAIPEAQWGALIQPHVAGLVAVEDISPDSLQKSLCTDEIKLEEALGVARLIHGLAADKTSGEQIYLLDLDFFCDTRLEIRDGLSRLDTYNRQAWNLFRWCINDSLHEALQPQAEEAL